MVFPATVLLSAFLLFQVQPLLGKFILPWFGGGPAVWTAAMLFFQIALFAGYAYAHLIVRFLTPRGQAITHFVLLGLACATLPIIPAESWKPTGDAEPVGRILILLLATVGPAYFALAATGPLLQAWYSIWRTDGAPYRLYALSNVGSLAGLLTYPLLVEPQLRLKSQAYMWSGGFGLFAVCCVTAAIVTTRAAGLRGESLVEGKTRALADRVSWFRRLAWIALPALGSVLLLAATNHVCQNVAVVPFLWVLPLALYLVTFIICFDKPAFYRRGVVAIVAVVWLVFMEQFKFIEAYFDLNADFRIDLGLILTGMFLGCFLCHGELVRLRPAPGRLTEFYLLMSFGGALGGLFVALVAPAVFDRFWEWPIAVLLTLLLALWIVWDAFPGLRLQQWPWWQLQYGAVLYFGVLFLKWAMWHELKVDPVISIDRNFYGVVSVTEEMDEDTGETYRTLINGSIQHGREFMDEKWKMFPTTYYGAETGAGQLLTDLQTKKKARVGAVGLGAGTIAAYARPGDTFRFYEINPIVVAAAKRDFFFMSAAGEACQIALGDARLNLEREESQQFDALILDAFSGDAIPTHLLTDEAIQLYLQHLAPDGVIAAHITNTYINLGPVVRALAKKNKLAYVEVDTDSDSANMQYHTRYILLTRDPARLSFVQDARTSRTRPTRPEHLWADDYSDLLSVIGTDDE
jgi:hypothetical protein